MSDNIHAVVRRQAGKDGDIEVFVTYKVELTSDARALVSSRLRDIEVHCGDNCLSLSPSEARRLAVTILGALDAIDPGAVVNR